MEPQKPSLTDIPLFKNIVGGRDLEYVERVLRRGMHWANGPEVAQLEEAIARRAGADYAAVFNSGTSALHAALVGLDVRGKEVIVPSFTFIATANAVLHAGARPIFADIEPTAYGLDVDDVRGKVTDETAAIMPIHYAGGSCRVRELAEFAADRGIPLLEDAAEALGSTLDGKALGTFGDAGMYSFAASKVISTGEGGAIVTNSSGLHDRLKLFRSHGRLETKDYFTSGETMDYVALGYNYRMPSIVAAQGLAQFEQLDRAIEARRSVARRYDAAFSKIPGISPPRALPGAFHSYQMYSIRVQEGRTVRDALQAHLAARKITSRVYFEPVHKTRFYRGLFPEAPELPVTEKVSGEILSLPMFPGLEPTHQDRVISEVASFLARATARVTS